LWRVIRQQKAGMDVGANSLTGGHPLKGTHHRRDRDTTPAARARYNGAHLSVRNDEKNRG
jgi:hypothetical protein